MSFDDFLERLNKQPRFKIVAFLLLAVPSFQNYSQLQNAIITIFSPNFQCQPNTTTAEPVPKIANDQCSFTTANKTTKCSSWNFSSDPFGVTQVTEFGLVCDRSFYGDMLLLTWYSTAVLAPIMGLLSDKYGRKKITLINLLVETISTIALGIMPDYFSGLMIRFVQGLSGSGAFIAFVWLMELIDAKFRTAAGTFFWTYGCLAYVMFPAIVWSTRNWRYTQMWSVIPSISYLLILFIPESPRWLLIAGRHDEAVEVVRYIQRFNNDDDNSVISDSDLQVDQDSVGSFRRACHSQVFLTRSTVAFFLQFSTFIFWSAVTINLTIVSNHIYLNIFLMGLMEIPTLFVAFLSLLYLPRKKSVLLFGGIGSTFFLITVFLRPDVAYQHYLRIFFGCIGKICIATVLQSSMVYVTELFPTTHRSFALIFVQIANFLSFLAAVFINKLSTLLACLPMLIYVCLFWTAYALVEWVLPETCGLPLPERIRDIERLQPRHEHEYQRTDSHYASESSESSCLLKQKER